MKDFLKEALLSMDRVAVSDILNGSMSEGFGSFAEVLTEALEDIGSEWENGELALSQVYVAGIISEEVMSSFLGSIPEGPKANPRIAIGVLEDHHILGKKIVLSLMRSKGLNVIDYGHGLSPEDVAQRAKENGIEYLCISSLMLHAAMKVKDLRLELDKRKCFPKIIVGGAPFRLDRSLWRDVGADAFCSNASEVFEYLPAKEEILF